MILNRILGFIVKRRWTLVLGLSLAVQGYILHNPPRHPDPASGHVFKVTALGGHVYHDYTVYLTSSERFLYHASIIVMVASMIGGVVEPAITRKRSRGR